MDSVKSDYAKWVCVHVWQTCWAVTYLKSLSRWLKRESWPPLITSLLCAATNRARRRSIPMLLLLAQIVRLPTAWYFRSAHCAHIRQSYGLLIAEVGDIKNLHDFCVVHCPWPCSACVRKNGVNSSCRWKLMLFFPNGPFYLELRDFVCVPITRSKIRENPRSNGKPHYRWAVLIMSTT